LAAHFVSIEAHEVEASGDISLGATRADQAVSTAVLGLLQPLGVEAALKEIKELR
jgi:hypothetical protein